jgi:alanyl-tRNA synthetase
MTDRLYLQNSFLDRFQGTVLEQRQEGVDTAVRLDQSAFYPESGGQMADRGELGAHSVVDVQQDGDGHIWHRIQGAHDLHLQQQLEGKINFLRRRSHMALHTGQHVLSRALADVAAATTLSSRLGESTCNIDIDRPKLGDSELARVESLANAVVNDDLPVRAYYPDEKELQQLKLRRPSKVKDNIRVIAIGDYDLTPCGGTHCSSSAQIGLIQIQSIQRHKQGLRILFNAGQRARDTTLSEASQLRKLAQRFSCRNDGIEAAIDKLEKQSNNYRRQSEQLAGQLASYHAAELRKEPQQKKHRLFRGLPIEGLRIVARELVQDANTLAILGSELGDGTHLVVARSSELELHCGTFLRDLITPLGGRGGGRPDHAEGRLPAGTDWASLRRALEN